MNMMPGTARAATAARSRVEFGDGVALPLPRGRARRRWPARCCTASVPSICALGDGAGLPVEVVVVEPTGADTQLYCRFDGQEVTAMIARSRRLRVRATAIDLAPDLARAHLFDAATGARLAA